MTKTDDICERCDCEDGLYLGAMPDDEPAWLQCPCPCHWTRAESETHEGDRRNKARQEDK